MSEKDKLPGADLFEQAMKNYEQALKIAVKVQEESGQWWAKLFSQPNWPLGWQKQMQSYLDESVPATQQRMEESLRLIEQNSRTSMELLKKAMEASRGKSFAETQAKMMEVWQGSLNAVQSNLQAITQAQAKMMEAWTEFVHKGTIQPAGTKTR